MDSNIDSSYPKECNVKILLKINNKYNSHILRNKIYNLNFPAISQSHPLFSCALRFSTRKIESDLSRLCQSFLCFHAITFKNMRFE